MNPIVRYLLIDHCQRPKKIWSGPRDIPVVIPAGQITLTGKSKGVFPEFI